MVPGVVLLNAWPQRWSAWPDARSRGSVSEVPRSAVARTGRDSRVALKRAARGVRVYPLRGRIGGGCVELSAMTEHWSSRPEGGGRFAIWLIRTIGLQLRPPVARLLLYPITLYFFCRRGPSAAFVLRIPGARVRQPATAWQVMRHIHGFAATILDRVFLLSDRFARFDVAHARARRAHVAHRAGSRRAAARLAHRQFRSVARAAAAERPRSRCASVLDTPKTPALTELLHALNPRSRRQRDRRCARPAPRSCLRSREAVREGLRWSHCWPIAARAHEATVVVRLHRRRRPVPGRAVPDRFGAGECRSCCASACIAAATATICTSNRSPNALIAAARESRKTALRV